MSKSTRIQIVSTIPLVLTAFDNYGLSNFLSFFINVTAIFINIVAIKFIDSKPSSTKIFLSLVNATMAFYNAYDYYINGKKYLPLAYCFVGLIFITSIFFIVRKANKKA